MKIPKKFKLFAKTYNIIFDNVRCNDKGVYGLHDYSKAEITLTDIDGINKLSEDTIMDTFYHEKIHAILDSMNKTELSNDEEFVDVFAKLIRQSIETEEY